MFVSAPIDVTSDIINGMEKNEGVGFGRLCLSAKMAFATRTEGWKWVTWYRGEEHSSHKEEQVQKPQVYWSLFLLCPVCW